MKIYVFDPSTADIADLDCFTGSMESLTSLSKTQPSWWKKLSRERQHKYLALHKLSHKKGQLNLKDRKGRSSTLSPTDAKPKAKKEGKRTYSSEELLKNAGISVPGAGGGLAQHSPLTVTPGPKRSEIKEQEQETGLPVVYPEHEHWQGLRKQAYKHVHTIGEKVTQELPKITVHRAYAGITDLMQGKQPNPVKRSAAESMVIDTIHALHKRLPSDERLPVLVSHAKEATSLYFGSVKARFKDKPLPFSDKTHEALRRFVPSRNKVNVAESSLGAKTEHDHMAHVAGFIATDFVEWVSTQPPSRLNMLLKSKKNGHLSYSDVNSLE
jgi:hypothetical protein